MYDRASHFLAEIALNFNDIDVSSHNPAALDISMIYSAYSAL